MKIFKQSCFIIIATNLLCASCSSDNDTDTKDSKVLDNTTWTYNTLGYHKTSSVAVDKNKTYTAVIERASSLKDLGYTENINEGNTPVDYNLCELSNHECDTTITAVFNSGKCEFNINIKKLHLKAEKVTIEKSYKFTKGNYTVAIGNMHHGVEVYNDAIYMYTNGGKELYLPLDGNCCAVYERNTIYKDKVLYDEDIEKYSFTTNFKILDNKIIFSYNDKGVTKTFDALMSSDGNSIIFTPNSITHSTACFYK